MRDERTPEENAAWDAILKLVSSLPEGKGGTSRMPGQFVRGYGDDEGGPFERFSVTTEYKQYNVRGDGVADVYDIEVTVTRRTDSNGAFWREQAADRQGAIVINGVHYRIGKNNGRTMAPFKGFGGRRFLVRRLNGGHIVRIDDLWYQGPIPPEFREMLPDNAEWVDPERGPFE